MYKALIVDDERMIRMGICHGIAWEEIGIGEVYTAASAKEALSLIEEHQPEIMITDISMTEMTGLDLIGQIRRDNDEMRILVLTGYDSFDYARECLRMRVQNFLLKPIDEEELKENLLHQVQELDEVLKNRELEESQMRTEGFKRQLVLEQFMRNLIHMRPMEEGQVTDMLERYHLERNQTMRAAILLPVCTMGGNQTEENFRIMSVKNICMGLLDAQNRGITFPDDNGQLVLLFYTGEEQGDLSDRMQQIGAILEDEYNKKPRIVLGSEVLGYEALGVSYNDAVYLLDHERAGIHEIVKTRHDQSREDIFQDIYQEFKQSMVENIANAEYLLHVLERFRKAADSYNLSQPQIRKCCFELTAGVCFAYLTETGERMEAKLDSLLESLMGANKEEVWEVTEMFLKQLLLKEETNLHEIIGKAKRFVEDHLDGDLSVATLAAQYYVTPNYFSRLFKRMMGEGCNEYIVRRRIEKSKSLLETTTMKTGKIAMMVGYNDTNYFSIAFKKHTGLSPTKYREAAQERG